MTAARICDLIIARLDGASLHDRPNEVIHTYGARPDDDDLVPAPTRAAISLASRDGAPWFEISVREFHPTGDPAESLLHDPEIMNILAHRAGATNTTNW